MSSSSDLEKIKGLFHPFDMFRDWAVSLGHDSEELGAASRERGLEEYIKRTLIVTPKKIKCKGCNNIINEETCINYNFIGDKAKFYHKKCAFLIHRSYSIPAYLNFVYRHWDKYSVLLDGLLSQTEVFGIREDLVKYSPNAVQEFAYFMAGLDYKEDLVRKIAKYFQYDIRKQFNLLPHSWVTLKGEVLKIKEMDSSHLKNCIRMIIRNSKSFVVPWKLYKNFDEDQGNVPTRFPCPTVPHLMSQVMLDELADRGEKLITPQVDLGLSPVSYHI